MDLWNVLMREKLNAPFGSEQLLLNTGDRHNSSINRYVDRSIELLPNTLLNKNYSDETRYIRTSNIGFDMLVVFFDVNSSHTIALRTSTVLTENELSSINTLIKKLKRSNIEIRLIGMQNNHAELASCFNSLHKKIIGVLSEADLFGKEQRHILIDTKTGMTYNLLLENRIYRPGELINKSTYEEFESSRKRLLIKE